MLKRLLLTSLITLAAVPCWGRTEQSTGMAAGVAGFDTNIVLQTHDNGYLRTTATNYGYFGTVRNRLVDSSGALVPVMESPVNSNIEYLYEAGLWIGGVVGGDTLVSSGSLGFGQAHELYADSYAPGQFSDSLGDDEWTFNFGDTTTDPETVRDDPYDGPHRSLPVRIRQKTYTFDALTYNSALFMELTVVNVGSQPIENAWVGWLVDPDIGHEDIDAYWLDDITGHVRHTVNNSGRETTISAAWAMDNDGDPDSTSQFDSQSPKRAFGSMYLGGTPALPGESYNWWVPSLRKAWDWGPQKFPGDTNIFGGRGYEVTDTYRYRLLSNQELDYAQPYAAVDQTADGWMPPAVDSIARELADGYEIRFLHSVGPISLAVGDSVVLHWVWCVAPYGHTQPSHFGNTFDADNPDAYLSGLGTDYLVQLLGDLRDAWDSAFALVPIGPPERVVVTSWDDTSGTLTWSQRSTERLRHYRVWRKRRVGELRHLEKSFIVEGETTLVDTGLDRSETYYYSVSCVGAEGSANPPSAEDSLLLDRPKAPTKPYADASAQRITLTWLENAETGVIGYRVYRREENGIWELRRGTEVDTAFVDDGVAGATVYEYRVTAVSSLDNESYPSEVVQSVAFTFDGAPQIIDYTASGPSSLTLKDSVAAVWDRLLANAIYRDASFNPGPFALSDFDSHPVTVVVSDSRSPLPAYDFRLLDLYSHSQGATIISGRDLFNSTSLLDTLVSLPEGNIAYAAGIRKAFYPRPLLANPTRMNAEFIAAIPSDPSLPRLDVDAARTGWGLNPALPHPGNAIPFVGYFQIDTSLAEVLYTFQSRDGNASPLHGKPVAVMSREPGRTLAVFAFPLSYLEEADAKACVAAVLARMGYGSTMAAGDANNDGIVTAADVVSVINYLYRDGFLINEKNADVNGDCVVDLLDAVTLSDHVYHRAPLSAPACEW